MNRIRRIYDHFFPIAKLIPPGIYTYNSPAGSADIYRLHLRIQPDGTGVLILNASTILHLSQTAAEYALYLMNGLDENEVAGRISRRYVISQIQALADYKDFKGRLDTLIHTPDLDPVTFLDFDQETMYKAAISSPYRLDCALTYQQKESNKENAAPVERVKRELSLEEWKQILTKAWKAGIPHVVFTGGEPTIRPDLLDLIDHAQKLGMVTGLLTSGYRLSNPDYLHSLLDKGLDHVMLVLDPEIDESREALRDLLAEDISVAVHITITEQILGELYPFIEYLIRLGVQRISLSTNNRELAQQLQDTRQFVAEKGLKLVWDLPVPYSHLHPVAFELEGQIDIPLGAGKAWLYVEPDGDVLPGQGILEPLGNFLNDPWETIWKTA